MSSIGEGFSLRCLVRPFELSQHRGSRHCEAPGCDQSTREAKPFCPKHVELSPYVQNVMAALRDAELEISQVRQFGRRAVSPTRLVSQEILRDLGAHGPQSIRCLARKLGLEGDILSVYAHALSRLGFVRLVYGRRRQLMIHPDRAA